MPEKTGTFRREYGRIFRFVPAILRDGPRWKNVDNGEVLVIPPPPNRGSDTWTVHVFSTGRRCESIHSLTGPDAEHRAFALAVLSISNLLGQSHDS